MRLIGSLNDINKGQSFSAFLSKKGIDHHLETTSDAQQEHDKIGHETWQIWITDEDQYEDALKWYRFFIAHPDDPLFKITLTHDTRKIDEIQVDQKAQSTKASRWERQPMGVVTQFFLYLCVLLFIATELTTPAVDIRSQSLMIPAVGSPVEKALLYDYPYTYQLVEQLVSQYGYSALTSTKELPPQGKQLVKQINNTPYWQGIYDNLVNSQPLFNDNIYMFEKIGQGEIWRLFTPALLHGGVLHILFNMLWLMVLGKQIEQRLFPARYILFILIAGIGSNTAQYLMSGPNFIGFSGILTAMFGFIWARQKKAPWEGYQLDKMTMLFISLFIGGIAALQAMAFIFEFFFNTTISAGVANTAHLTGAGIGYFLGKWDFFRWK